MRSCAPAGLPPAIQRPQKPILVSLSPVLAAGTTRLLLEALSRFHLRYSSHASSPSLYGGGVAPTQAAATAIACPPSRCRRWDALEHRVLTGWSTKWNRRMLESVLILVWIVLASEFFFACDCLKVHAEEHRFLMGSDGAGGSDALANDSSSSDFSGHTFVDIFGDTDQSSMSFVTNRPQVGGPLLLPDSLHCPSFFCPPPDVSQNSRRTGGFFCRKAGNEATRRARLKQAAWFSK